MKKIIYNSVGFLIFVLCWQMLSTLNNGVFISDVKSIGKSFISVICDFKLYLNVISTLLIVISGVIIAVIVGVGISFIFVFSDKMYNVFELVVTFIRHIPTIALFPVLIVMFGISNMARIVLIFLNSVPCIILSSYHGLKSVDKSLIEASQCDGASKLIILLNIQFPIALDEILNGVSISIGTGFVAVVVAEMLGASSGIGFMIMWSNNAFKYSDTYVYISILAFLGVILNYFLNLIIKRYKRYIYG